MANVSKIWGLNAPLKLTDKNQNSVWQAEQKGFEFVVHQQDVVQPLRFVGQVEDTETGFYYNYHRYYNPKIGRYTQPDPIGLAGGINPYVYADNNPIMNVDPSGQNAIRAIQMSFVAGQRIGRGINYGVHALTGSTLGALLYDVLHNESEKQNEKRPKNCPSGTQDIDKVKSKYNWDKDKLHGIKDAAHGGMGTGKSWTGVAPDGTVGINEGGEWSPQGHWEDLL